MRMFALLVVLLAGCSDGGSPPNGSEPASIPADWVQMTATCGYSFMAPPDIVSLDAQGDDSCVDAWRMDSCVLQGERETIFGPGPAVETEELLDFRESTETIDGRSAQLVTTRNERFPANPFVSSVFFAGEASEPAIAVWAFCSTEAGRDETLLLYRSITIHDARPQ